MPPCDGLSDSGPVRRESKGLFSSATLKAMSGGLGIGGAGFVDIEDLMLKFGESVAKRTSRWAEGKPIEMNTVK